MKAIVAKYVAVLLVAISATVALRAQSAPVNYVYDELGRLVAVIDGTGARAVYIYDAVGNLTSIERYAAGTVSVIEFTPNDGSVGTAVTIYGTGFSTTPSQNTVTFNGVSATVTSSTENQIVATVPAGATTGTIAVTTPSGSASGSTAFVVGSSGPTITSVSPQVGVAGTAVTINGTNFNAIAANNSVKVNVTYAPLSSSSTTAIATTVPVQTGSGPIVVATPSGVANGGDFFVPPSPYVASDVQFTGRNNLGQSSTVSITTATKIGLVVFDGVAGGRIALNATNETFTNVTGCDVLLDVLNPNLTELGPDTCLDNGAFMDVRTLPVSGTYTLVFDPGSTSTGGVSVTLYDVPPDSTGTITAGGSSVTVTTTAVGQNGVRTFSGTANQRVSVLGVNETFSTVSLCDVLVSIRKPDGTALGTVDCLENGGFVDVRTLPEAGIYTVLTDPRLTSTGSITLTLHDVPSDVTGMLTIGDPAVGVTITTPGQNGVFTFSGTQGQQATVRVTNNTIGFTQLQLLKPDQSQLAFTGSSASSFNMATQTLPVTGTYTLKINPGDANTGTLDVNITSP